MSTYVYLECLDHDPPLSSHGEVGQHLSDLPRVRQMIAQRAAIVSCAHAGWPNYYTSFDSNAAWFLVQHPKCHIGIRDEYGDEHPISDENREAKA